MDSPTERRRLAGMAGRLAARFESDPTTMAWVIARYREAEGVDDMLVAVALGIDADQLPHLALCNRPRPELFAEDIETIADHIGVERERLANLVRQVEALAAFGRIGAHGGRAGGLLAAARDRAAEDPGSYEPDGGEEGKRPDESGTGGEEP